ncbi:MAG: hypothetical protein AAF203_00430 [Pseudomonadota bacterium]
MKWKALIAIASVFAMVTLNTACEGDDLRARKDIEPDVAAQAAKDPQAMKDRVNFLVTLEKNYRQLLAEKLDNSLCSTEIVNKAAKADDGKTVNSVLSIKTSAAQTEKLILMLLEGVENNYCGVNLLVEVARISLDTLVTNGTYEMREEFAFNNRVDKAVIIYEILVRKVKELKKTLPSGQALNYEQYKQQFKIAQEEISALTEELKALAEELEAYMTEKSSTGKGMIMVTDADLAVSSARQEILELIKKIESGFTSTFEINGSNDPDLGKKVSTLQDLVKEIKALIQTAKGKLAWAQGQEERAKMEKVSKDFNDDPQAAMEDKKAKTAAEVDRVMDQHAAQNAAGGKMKDEPKSEPLVTNSTTVEALSGKEKSWGAQHAEHMDGMNIEGDKNPKGYVPEAGE